MSLPTFKTDIRDIDTQGDAAMVLTDFLYTFNREDLFEAAEDYVRHRMPNGSVYTFRHMDGGLMRMVIGLIIQGVTDGGKVEPLCWLEEKLMEHYRFTQESIPPRMILREAVATRVRLNSLLADLSRETDREDINWASRVKAAAKDLVAPEDGHKLSDEQCDQIIRGY